MPKRLPVEALYGPRRVVRRVQGARYIQTAAGEIPDEAFQERLRQADVGVEEDHHVARGALTAQIPAPCNRTFPVQDPHPGELACHGDRSVVRARVNDDHLLRPPSLAPDVPDQVPDVPFFVERRYDDAHGGRPFRGGPHTHDARLRTARRLTPSIPAASRASTHSNLAPLPSSLLGIHVLRFRCDARPTLIGCYLPPRRARERSEKAIVVLSERAEVPTFEAGASSESPTAADATPR